MYLFNSMKHSVKLIAIILMVFLCLYCYGYTNDFFNENDQSIALENHIKKLNEQIERDKKVLQSFDFESIARNIEEWQNLSIEAQKELKDTFFGEITNLALSGLQIGAKEIGSMGTGQGNKVIGYLQKHHIDVTELNNAIRQVAHTKGKPAMAEKFNDAIDKISKIIDTYQIGSDLKNMNRRPVGNLTDEINSTLEILATAMGMLNGDTKLSILVSEAKIFCAALYNNVARRISIKNIERLTKLTEDQLKAQKIVIELLIKHVNELKYVKGLKANIAMFRKESEEIKSEKTQLDTEKIQLNSLIDKHNESCTGSKEGMQEKQEIETRKKEYFKKKEDLENSDKNLKERKASLNEEITAFLKKQGIGNIP